MSFNLKCNKCGNEIIITGCNIKDILTSSESIDIIFLNDTLQLYCSECENYMHNKEN